MPQGSTAQQFCPECNIYVFTGKLVDSIYRGPGKNGKFFLQVLPVKNFDQNARTVFFALRLLDSTYKGPRKKRKNIKNK